MLKKRLMAVLLVIVFAFSLSSGVLATTGEQDTMERLNENDIIIEPVDIEDLPAEVMPPDNRENDILKPGTVESVDIPLNIKLSESGKITSISPKKQSDLKYEVYILQNQQVLLDYNSTLGKNSAETSKLERVALAEGEKYFMSIMVTNKDTIDSYDGYFSIVNSAIVYDSLFYSSADIAALNGTASAKSTQYETETNNGYSAADDLIEGNNMYGKISSETDRDWYRCSICT